jgi:hypothetical protein
MLAALTRSMKLVVLDLLQSRHDGNMRLILLMDFAIHRHKLSQQMNCDKVKPEKEAGR